MKRYWLVLLIILLSFNCLAQDVKKKPMKAAALSLLVPGGGQLYNESYLKFGIVAALEGGLIGITLYHYFKGEDYYDKYISTGNEKYFEKYTDYYYKQQNDLWWLGVTVFLSTVDAYVDAHLYDFEPKKQKIRLKFDGDVIGLEFKF